MLRDITPRVRKAKTGLIAYTRTIQYLLEDEVEKSFGLAYIGLNQKDRYIPMEDLENTDTYESLQPDGSVESFSFMYIKGPIVARYEREEPIDQDRATLSVVVYGTGKHHVEEAERIRRKLEELVSFKVEKIYLNGKDAYADFGGVETKDRHFYAPHYCFRFEGELYYPTQQDCFDQLPYLVKNANKIEE